MKMKTTIKDLFQRYLDGNLPDNTSNAMEKYSRKALAGKIAKLLDETELQ